MGTDRYPTNTWIEKWLIVYGSYTGWWYTYPSEKYEFVSWDDYIPNIWKNKKMFQTTNQSFIMCPWIYMHMCYKRQESQSYPLYGKLPWINIWRTSIRWIWTKVKQPLGFLKDNDHTDFTHGSRHDVIYCFTTWCHQTRSGMWLRIGS